MNKGIVIYAFKKPAYGKFAYNLAASIKFHSPELPICLIHDELALTHLSIEQKALFDTQIIIATEDLYDDRKFSPGKAKILGYKYFPYDQNMVIDADSLCIQALEPLFDKYNKKPIYSQCSGTWTEEANEWTCQWLPLTICKELFDLPKTYRLFEINSSFVLVRKCKESEDFYNQAYQNYLKGVGHPKLGKWGGSFPDELALNIAFAQTGLQPNFEDLLLEEINNVIQKPVFFSTNYTNRFGQIQKDYYFLGFYGGRNFTSHSLQDFYDAKMREICGKLGLPFHQWKCHLLMKDKHVNEK